MHSTLSIPSRKAVNLIKRAYKKPEYQDFSQRNLSFSRLYTTCTESTSTYLGAYMLTVKTRPKDAPPRRAANSPLSRERTATVLPQADLFTPEPVERESDFFARSASYLSLLIYAAAEALLLGFKSRGLRAAAVVGREPNKKPTRG